MNFGYRLHEKQRESMYTIRITEKIRFYVISSVFSGLISILNFMLQVCEILATTSCNNLLIIIHVDTYIHTHTYTHTHLPACVLCTVNATVREYQSLSEKFEIMCIYIVGL